MHMAVTTGCDDLCRPGSSVMFQCVYFDHGRKRCGEHKGYSMTVMSCNDIILLILIGTKNNTEKIFKIDVQSVSS